MQTPFTGSLSFGIMFHSFSYEERIKDERMTGTLFSQFAPIAMTDGVISFIRPEECTIRHELHDYKVKEFHEGSYSLVEDVWKAYEAEGGMMDESVAGSIEHL